jgi:hypothetical protein
LVVVDTGGTLSPVRSFVAQVVPAGTPARSATPVAISATGQVPQKERAARVGAIAGILVGFVVLLGIGAFAVYWVRRKRMSKDLEIELINPDVDDI